MTIATTNRMTIEEYQTYDDGTDSRHELVRGELVAMSPPTWLHIAIAKYLERIFDQEIERLGYDWEAFREPGQQTEESSARVPDLAVVPRAFVQQTLNQSAILTTAAFLVVEVVSESTVVEDYRDKLKEYQEIGIQEYWVVDPVPFGAAKYIGAAKLPTVSVYHLVEGQYQVSLYQDEQIILSPTFPALNLTAAKVLKAGK
jgi:Uma2 family endonuclease